MSNYLASEAKFLLRVFWGRGRIWGMETKQILKQVREIEQHPERTILVEVELGGDVLIGSGSNTSNPRIRIEQADLPDLVFMLNRVMDWRGLP